MKIIRLILILLLIFLVFKLGMGYQVIVIREELKEKKYVEVHWGDWNKHGGKIRGTFQEYYRGER